MTGQREHCNLLQTIQCDTADKQVSRQLLKRLSVVLKEVKRLCYAPMPGFLEELGCLHLKGQMVKLKERNSICMHVKT